MLDYLLKKSWKVKSNFFISKMLILHIVGNTNGAAKTETHKWDMIELVVGIKIIVELALGN